MTTDTLKEIDGWPNYSITSTGVVISTQFKKPVVRKLASDKDGYKIVALCRGGLLKLCKVHRLVALAFIPNPDNLPTVNHKNGDKADNRVENLEWASYAANNQHAYDELGKTGPRSGILDADNPTVKPVIQFDDKGFCRFWWSAFQAGKVLGCPSTHITRVCHGRRKHTRGYRWRYATESEIKEKRDADGKLVPWVP